MLKRKVARVFVDWTDGWNHELHGAIETKVIDAFNAMYGNATFSIDERAKTIDGMRGFYYTRMMTTATLLLAGVSLMVAGVALVVSVLAIL